MTSITQEPMAVSILAGANGLVQLGLSISDLALLVDTGKKFGNFLRAGQNDSDLFDILGEDREEVLKRAGLVEVDEMEKTWPDLNFVHRGVKLEGNIKRSTWPQAMGPDVTKSRRKRESSDGVDSFTWVMVAIVSALDQCLPSNEIQELLIEVFVKILDRDDDITTALRIHIRKNIESWRSFGCARHIGLSIKTEMRKSLAETVHDPNYRRSIPQLNDAEKQDTGAMLIWLLRGDAGEFSAMSAITFSIAEALRKAKLDLCTDGNPTRETQACVAYHPEGQLLGGPKRGKTVVPRGLGFRPIQISWPRENPASMIEALGVSRDLANQMHQAWSRGRDAAEELTLIGGADGSYGYTNEVYYTLQVPSTASITRGYAPHIGMLADQGFPQGTELIYSALEWMLEREPKDSARWLQNHTEREYLLRAETVDDSPRKEHASVFCKYQAFVFGFYYQLLQQILFFDLVHEKAFFQGIWGANSTTFLAMCTQLGRCLRSDEKVSRAHILYMLAAMYNGRRKVFNAQSSAPQLVGIIGPISVLVLPLVRTTDVPEEIWKIAIVDLPIADLTADNADGELMASEGGGLVFHYPSEYDKTVINVQPASPTQEWTVHPYMSIALGGEKTSGVVMAARCGERLVGWFNPLAADISFLSSAYLKESYSEDDVNAFEVKDKHWKAGKPLQPDTTRPGSAFGVVHSHNSGPLRYAAAGFYAEKGEEVAIARSANEFCGAFGRIQAQERGIVIA
ncbi:hypothetical protein DDE82_005118 [Stemphylium lycopersici]|nr:hypothetical protein DDE82_005118 [Stemphylium lycopersici]